LKIFPTGIYFAEEKLSGASPTIAIYSSVVVKIYRANKYPVFPRKNFVWCTNAVRVRFCVPVARYRCTDVVAKTHSNFTSEIKFLTY
jgi:hypothetical protein